jgi:hypothetical protein
MKKSLLTIVVVLFGMASGIIQAQTYENVLKADSTSWISWHRELEYTMRHVIYVKQTNGINNLYISTSLGYSTDTYFVGTLREDDGRLWITYPDFPNNEYLLMDMNLEVGDEFAFDVYNNIIGTVSEIRYENGHKIIVFGRVSYKWYQEPLMFIEGVGRNIIGFLHFDHDQFYQSCKFDGQELAYSTPNTHFRDCEIITDDTYEHFGSNQWIEVYPNPCHDVIHIILDDKNNNIFIYDNQGVMVSQFKNIVGSSFDIDMSDCQEGLYLLKLVNDSNVITFRIIKY